MITLKIILAVAFIFTLGTVFGMLMMALCAMAGRNSRMDEELQRDAQN